MNGHSLLKYLRVGFSATCGIACVLLVVLWVRSYQTIDVFTFAPTKATNVRFQSAFAAIVIHWEDRTSSRYRWPMGVLSRPIPDSVKLPSKPNSVATVVKNRGVAGMMLGSIPSTNDGR